MLDEVRALVGEIVSRYNKGGADNLTEVLKSLYEYDSVPLREGLIEAGIPENKLNELLRLTFWARNINGVLYNLMRANGADMDITRRDTILTVYIFRYEIKNVYISYSLKQKGNVLGDKLADIFKKETLYTEYVKDGIKFNLGKAKKSLKDLIEDYTETVKYNRALIQAVEATNQIGNLSSIIKPEVWKLVQRVKGVMKAAKEEIDLAFSLFEGWQKSPEYETLTKSLTGGTLEEIEDLHKTLKPYSKIGYSTSDFKDYIREIGGEELYNMYYNKGRNYAR